MTKHVGGGKATLHELAATDEAVWPIPKAGQLFGMNKTSAYDAAKAGDLPTLTLNGRFYVPVTKLREMLGVTPTRGTQGYVISPADLAFLRKIAKILGQEGVYELADEMRDVVDRFTAAIDYASLRTKAEAEWERMFSPDDAGFQELLKMNDEHQPTKDPAHKGRGE